MKLTISNFRGIEARTIEANGHHVRLKGVNGSGKTSAALAFLTLLTGKGSEQPVRDGADKAELELDVGDFVFKRTIKKDGAGQTFVGRGKAGKSLPTSPAEFVRSLIGSGLALDPLSLFSMSDAEQADRILGAWKVDVTAEEQASKTAWDARAAVNARKKAADERVKDLEAKGARQDAPAPASEVELQKKLEEAERILGEEQKRETKLAAAEARATNARAALERAIAENEAAEAELAQIKEQPVDVVSARSAVSKLRADFAAVGAANRAAEMGAELRSKLKQSEDLRAESEVLTKKLDELAAARAGKIAGAATAAGLDGLQFSPDRKGVNFKGVRLAALNTAQKIKLGLKIGLAERPELRLAIVDQASELDDASTLELLQWSDAADVQLVLACIERAGKGLEIEVFDGGES